MMCATILTAAAASVALDREQHKLRQKKGLPPQRIRPFTVRTVLLLFAAAIASVIFHSKLLKLG